MLADHAWKLKYTPDLVQAFYIPSLEDVQRYDRLTGVFNARALPLAARGVEGFVRKGGRMRLVGAVRWTRPRSKRSTRANRSETWSNGILRTVPSSRWNSGRQVTHCLHRRISLARRPNQRFVRL